jgi:integrase
MKILTAAQVKTFLGAIDGDPLEVLYVLALTSGSRSGELLGLTWSAVDLDGAAISISQALHRITLKLEAPKTSGSIRMISLPDIATRALRRHKARQNEQRLAVGADWVDEDLVFTNATGGPLIANHLNERSFYPLLKRAWLPRVRFHDLRHGFASLHLKSGTHIKIVSEALGHSSVAITADRYSHIAPGMQKEAASRLNDLLTG